MTLCNNCNRKNVDTTLIPWDKLKTRTRKKYFNIIREGTEDEVSLCKLCRQYLLQPSTTKPKCQTYWPSMMWKFLIHDIAHPNLIDLSTQERWQFIPAPWRSWWVDDVSRCDDTISLMTPNPTFYLATSDLEELEEAITSLSWKTLGKAIDKYVAYPSVRCPFGCSEFLHLCNKLPLEDFLTARSNGCFKTYSSSMTSQKGSWTNGMKPNYPSSISLLENDLHFICRPMIVLDDHLGPCILACAHHRCSSTEKYIHPPESPTGTLYTEKSNQYAQAIIQSRTLRKTKLNSYCDTYQTAILQGGFDGLDSCYLTSAGKYATTNSLASCRDLLSISGRDDVRNHIAQLSSNPEARNYLPSQNVKDKLKQAQLVYPDVKKELQQYLRSATFVTLNDAIHLQEQAYDETAITLTIFPQDIHEEQASEEVLFKAPWPTALLFVHPFDDFGQQLHAVHDKDIQCFVGWSMLATIMCIPFLWSITATSLENNLDWKGWLLSIAWGQISSGKTKNRAKNYFPLHNHTLPDSALNQVEQNRLWLRKQLGIQERSKNWNTKLHHSIWKNMAGVHVMQTRWLETDDNLAEATVVILICNPKARHPYIPFLENNAWELRLLILKEALSNDDWNGTLYARHGASTGVRWWMQPDKKSPYFYKCHDLTIQNVVSSLELCVYVRLKQDSATTLRHRYLSCLGGQTVIHCNHHKLPLILHPLQNKRQSIISTDNRHPQLSSCYCCSAQDSCLDAIHQKSWTSVTTFCTKEGSLVCPHVGCNVALCNKHFTSLMTNTDGYIYMLEKGKCYSVTLQELITSQSPLMTLHNGQYQEEHSMHGMNDEMNNLMNDDVSLVSSTSDDTEDIPMTATDNLTTKNSNPIIDNLGPSDGYEYPRQLLSDCDTDTSDEDDDDKLQHFLTTNSATEVHDIQFEAPDEILSCPLHVLLNQQGHLLVRNNSKLRMNRRHANFFQRIVATTRGKTIPLVYAEALLFPDTFYFGTTDGSILGALPTALWTDERHLSMLGIASMRKHAKARLLDPATLCSTDPRYHFMMFDCLVNLGMRGQDSRLILHRGFADKQDGDGVAFNNKENTELYADAIENHSNVHKLASIIAESPPHFFFTQSCNQSTCPGLSKLRKWITSEDTVSRIKEKYNLTQEEASSIVRKTAAPFVQRIWDVIADLWMRYIVYSKEEPLHKIEWAWWRKEFQDEAGNPSHIHALLRTVHDITTEDGRNIVLQKIRGSLDDLIHYDEFVEMKEEGLINSIECFHHFLQQAFAFLTHRCNTRCQIPKIQPDGDVTFVCKVPANILLTPYPQIHTIQPVPTLHSPAALQILLRLGLAQEFTSCDGAAHTINVTHPSLRMERHIPKTSWGRQKFSPTNGRLFAMMPSSQNLQYCTGHSLSLYLTSYVTEIDRVSLILVRPPTTAIDHSFRLQYESLNNTKIGSVNNYHKQRIDANHKVKSLPQGRVITHMEALTVIFGSPLVYSTREFIHYPTCPREYRTALYIPYCKTTRKPQDLQAIHAVIGETVRNELNFPDCRHFTPYQIKVIQDEILAPLSTDQLTYFSMRPPELRFIRSQILYLKWFERKPVVKLFDPGETMKYLRKHLSLRIHDSEWIDGLNYKMVLRLPAIQPCLHYAQQADAIHFGQGNQGMVLKRTLIKLLSRLLHLYQTIVLGCTSRRVLTSMQENWARLSQTFLSNSKTKALPIPWFTPVFPKRKNAFLIQLLLTMGEFETEYALMSSGDLRTAFISANLFDPTDPAISIDNLLKRYVLEQLRTFPGSHYTFDTNLCLADNILREVLLGTTPLTTTTPSVLYSHMKEETNTKIEHHIQNERNRLIRTLYTDLTKCGFSMCLPPEDQVQLSRQNPIPQQAISFYPPPQCPRQNSKSYQEQCQVLHDAKIHLDDYMNPTSIHRNLTIVGGPGVGKTTICQLITLYALCCGLNCTATSLVAERSKQLGGTHIHRLFGLRGNDITTGPGRIAESTIHNLYRHPDLLWLIKCLDFIFIDEFGLLNAQLVAVIDMIMRYVRRCPLYMGGIFIVTTLDVKQLMPFVGIPAILSAFVITEYRFIELTQSVRASNDAALQEICELTRTFCWTTSLRDRLALLLSQHCNFVNDFNSPQIPEDAVFVFGRRAPCNAAETLMLKRMKLLHANNFVIAHAEDHQSSTAGNWKKASPPVTHRLSRIIKCREELVFYPKARFEFTYNGEKDMFMQGQLAICLDVPYPETILAHEPITLFKAPPGLKEFPSNLSCNAIELSALGWSKVLLPYSTSQAHNVFRGIQARRCQYGIKPRVSSTIHGCMGATMTGIVTALVPLNGNSLDFSLWESAQVVVLLSRTEKAKDIYFVGDKNDTIKHILEVLQKTHRFLPYISSLLDNVCHERTRTPIFEPPPLYRPCDAIVGHIKCVYLIVSTKNVSYSYIGETSNLGYRLTQHNTGHGAYVTNNPALQPWALMGYVIGFESKHERLLFEAKWKITYRRRHGQNSTAEMIFHTAHSLLEEINPTKKTSFLLRLVRCGHISSTALPPS